MLNKEWYELGEEIKTPEQARKCKEGFYIRDKYNTYGIDAKMILRGNDLTDEQIQQVLDKYKDRYTIWEKKLVKRKIIYSEKIDQILNDLIMDFAINTEIEYYPQETPMDKLLNRLNEYFDITLKGDK